MNKSQLIIKTNYYIGIILFYLGFYKKANESFSKVLRINDKNAEAYNFRGMTYAALGHYHEAINDYIKATELNPYYINFENKNPFYPFLKEKYIKTIKNKNYIIELKLTNTRKLPNYPRYGGLIYYELKKYEEAISDFTKSIKINKEYADAYQNRGSTFRDLKKFPEAINDLTEAIKLDDKNSKSYNNRGLTYFDYSEQKKDNDKEYEDTINNAIDDFTEAIKLDNKNAEAFNNRGLAYFYLRNLKKDKEYEDTTINNAIDDFTEAVEIKKGFADAYNYRGAAFASLGKSDRAITDYTKAIKLDDKNSEAFNNRGL